MEYYGNSGLDDRSIMVVPCDTPWVMKENYNQLIGKVINKNADVVFPMVAEKLLTLRYPQRRLRGVYLADVKTKFTMQRIIFISGEFIRTNPSADKGSLKFTLKDWDERGLSRVLGGINDVDVLRHRSYFYDKLFLTWLLTKGYSSYIFMFLVDLAFNKLTLAKVIKYLSAADHMKADFVESEEVEFSANIDRPEDFQTVLGFPWQS